MTTVDNSTVSSLCHLWLSPLHCPEPWLDRKTIHDGVFFGLTILVAIFFYVCSIRRWVIVRKFELNAHTILDINLHISLLGWFGFYPMSLARVSSVLWLKSFLYYCGFTLCCSSIAVIIAAVLQLEKPVAFRNRSVSFLHWPVPLSLAYVVYLAITITTSFGQGIISENDVWYRISYPLYLGSVSVFFWCDILVLVIGTYRIRQRLKEAMAIQGLKELTGEAKRVNRELTIIVVLLCFFILLPASIGTALLACGAKYADGHYWSTEALYSMFMFLVLLYIVYWSIMFWKAGSRKLESAQGSSFGSSQFSAGSYDAEGK